MRGKAFRRHQNNRMFQRAYRIFTRRNEDSFHTEKEVVEQARFHRDILQACSCYMCGNPRKHFEEITLQEKKALLS